MTNIKHIYNDVSVDISFSDFEKMCNDCWKKYMNSLLSIKTHCWIMVGIDKGSTATLYHKIDSFEIYSQLFLLHLKLNIQVIQQLVKPTQDSKNKYNLLQSEIRKQRSIFEKPYQLILSNNLTKQLRNRGLFLVKFKHQLQNR